MSVLRIGAFSREAGVSIKTLRFYDRAGVFRPAYVDACTGYRYYDIKQLPVLRELRLLRSSGFAVAQLRAWADRTTHPGHRLALLLSVRERLQEQLRQDRARLHSVDRWIRILGRAGQADHGSIPTVRSIPAIPALTIRERVRTGSGAIYRMFESAERTVAGQGVRAARRPFLLLHDGGYRSGKADVEVCIPVHETALSAVGGRIVEGARNAACLVFGGSYAGAPAAQETLERWMRVNGAQPSGPLRESYCRFAADRRGYQLPKRFIASSVSEYRTELQLPIL